MREVASRDHHEHTEANVPSAEGALPGVQGLRLAPAEPKPPCRPIEEGARPERCISVVAGLLSRDR